MALVVVAVAVEDEASSQMFNNTEVEDVEARRK